MEVQLRCRDMLMRLTILVQVPQADKAVSFEVAMQVVQLLVVHL